MSFNNFLSLLNEKKIIDFNKIKEDSSDGFENRLKTQKLVYLAKYFGFSTNHKYDMHLNGPYSTTLTQKYYKIKDDELHSNTFIPNFNEKEFLALLKNKTADWLEIATTLIHEKHKFDDKDVLIEYVGWIKCKFTERQIEDVYIMLRNSPLRNLLG